MPALDRNVVIHGKNPNSQKAADNAYLQSGTWRRRIFDYIASRGFNGATDQEIQANFNKSGDTIRPSRKTLEQDGLIVNSGRTRQNDSGNNCTIWVTSEFAEMMI
jgi:predicted transcriptional regulator